MLMGKPLLLEYGVVEVNSGCRWSGLDRKRKSRSLLGKERVFELQGNIAQPDRVCLKGVRLTHCAHLKTCRHIKAILTSLVQLHSHASDTRIEKFA